MMNTPSTAPQAAPPIDRSIARGIVAGVGIVRREIFRAPITNGAWHSEMVRAIGVAKSLGFTMFEIDTKPGVTKVAQQPQQMQGLYTISYTTDGDDWKGDSPAAAAKMVDVETTFVHVYALVVETA